MPTAQRPFRVVIGIDFSPLSELALMEAIALAGERSHAEIEVVHVLPRDHHQSTTERETAEQQVAARLREAAHAAACDARVDTTIAILTHVLRGSPAAEIVRVADAVEADLVVVGRHGWRGMKRLLSGTVADKVLRNANCPVMLVRPRAYDPHPELVPEPPCETCVETRRTSAGFRMWCSAHDKPWVPAHRYHYDAAIDMHPYHADGIGGDQPNMSTSAVPISEAVRSP